MKKLTLLVGALGGTLAGYLFSNKPLRDSLAKAKDAEAAATLLGKHLQKDGKLLAKEVQQFVKSDEVQANVKKAKKYAQKTLDSAKKELKQFMGNNAGNVGKKAKRGAKKAMKTMKTKIRSLS